jgi:dihydroorotase (multifunctional complex type)
MCLEAFPLITRSGLPLAVHAENREIIDHCTKKLQAEGRNSPTDWESSRPAVCEAASVAHALFFAETFGTKLHVLHVSSRHAARMVAAARKRRLRVTAETTPHHLLRESREMAHLGSLLKINPPVRDKEHAEALWEGIRSGDIDMIASDHSPHTPAEKTKAVIWDCPSGFCGVETGVSVMLTEVNRGRLTLENYARIASENPARVWQLYPQKGAIRLGSDGDVTIVDMNREGVIDANALHSKNKVTPWHGWKVKGMPVYTIVRGRVQMRDGEVVGKPVGRAVHPAPGDLLQ